VRRRPGRNVVTEAQPLLQMRDIVKSFGGVRANAGISLDVAAGQIVGLLGENGSGKSTLMKILFGMIAPDGGGIIFKGRELSSHTPGDAIAAGIGMIHQHFMLVDAMTVAENVMLGWRAAGRWLHRAAVARALRETSARYGLDLDSDAEVDTLPLGRRQRVEILKAILRGADLFILDEPTSNLSPPEVSALLKVMRRLRAEGKSIIFISHKLHEVLEICDEIVVLRDGKAVGRMPAAAATKPELARLMVGRDVSEPLHRAERAPGSAMLTLANIGLPAGEGGVGLHDINLSVAAGEVLAIAGVDGNGQAELAETIAGMRRPTGGRILIGDADVTRHGVAARVAAGLAYIPADRNQMSLVQAMTVAENLVLRDVRSPPYARHGWLNRAAQMSAAGRLIHEFDIRAPGPGVAVQKLSGGNQQKIVVAREVDRAPGVLVALQATWGLDPGATRFVLDRVLELRARGATVLYISSELEEVLAIGDRIGVLFAGRLAAVLPRAEATAARIGLLMAGGADAPPGIAA
jgi:general nucleoside transport system ATP-binding protein